MKALTVNQDFLKISNTEKSMPLYYGRSLVYIPVDARKKHCQKNHLFMYVFLKVNYPAIKLHIYLDNHIYSI
jgi:hypothetical protein